MLDLSRALVPLVVIVLFYVLKKYTGFRQIVRDINDWPGFRTVLSDRFLFFPFQVRGISPGSTEWPFYSKFGEFEAAGWDVITAVNALPTPGLTIYVADPAIAKEVIGARARFPKPLETYALLAVFGTNILVTEGDEWKRQRKTAAPAFSEKNNRLVWDESVRIVEDMFESAWEHKDVVEVDHVMDVTVPITLLVIGAASFGRRMSWNEDSVAPAGHSLTFKDALHEVSHRLFFCIVFPQWMLRLGTPKMRYFARAYDELGRYLKEMVQERRVAAAGEGEREEHHDLFNSLLDANEGETESDSKLSDSALLGNVFVFLVAGYETTSHTLAYAFIFLALYQEEQEKYYQNLKTLMPTDRRPSYEEFGTFAYSLAVFNETLRHFPPVINIPKQSADDTVFTLTNAAGEKRSIPVPRGAYISICTTALHHNPRYWDDPEAFRPERFLGNYPRDAFLPFSGGPRGCIGRGFAETEAVAVLTMVLSRYKVEVREDPRFAGESFTQRKARLMKSQHSLTVYPEHAPLVFRRR